MIYTKNKLFRLNIFENIFWFVFGIIIFLPIEIIADGFYFAYLQGLFLIFFQKRVPAYKSLIIFFGYSLIVCASILNSENPTLVSMVNPILIALFLIIGDFKERSLRYIKLGLVFCAGAISLYLIVLVTQRGLDSFSSLMLDREWAINEIPFFGNGLAVLLILAMIYAVKAKNIFLLMLFFVGGALTTSRLPFVAIIIIMIAYLFHERSKVLLLVLVILFLFFSLFGLNAFLNYFSDVGSLSERIIFMSDRFDIYNSIFKSIYEHPLLGVGSIKLDFYEHAHNSYLQILYKYGFPALIIFMVLVFLGVFENLISEKDYIAIIIVIACTITQIALLSPNFLLILKLLVINSKCKLMAENK